MVGIAPTLQLVNTNNVFTFTELAGVTGSTFLHAGAKIADLTDDNNTSPWGPFPPDYEATFAFDPNPQILPGSFHVEVHSSTDAVDTTGSLDLAFSVLDNQLDFLREGQTVTQNIIVTLTDH